MKKLVSIVLAAVAISFSGCSVESELAALGEGDAASSYSDIENSIASKGADGLSDQYQAPLYDIAKKNVADLTSEELKILLCSTQREIIAAYNIDLTSQEQMSMIALHASPSPAYGYLVDSMAICFPWPSEWSEFTDNTKLTEDDLDDLPIFLYWGSGKDLLTPGMSPQECDEMLGEVEDEYETVDRSSGTTALVRYYQVDEITYMLCFLALSSNKGYELDYVALFFK